jgi:putative endonuclease
MGGWVYMMTNRRDGTLYVGGASDLPRRAYQHRESLIDGFTKRYGLKMLVSTMTFAVQSSARRQSNAGRGHGRCDSFTA